MALDRIWIVETSIQSKLTKKLSNSKSKDDEFNESIQRAECIHILKTVVCNNAFDDSESTANKISRAMFS